MAPRPARAAAFGLFLSLGLALLAGGGLGFLFGPRLRAPSAR